LVTDKPLPDLRVVKVLLKMTLEKNCVNVLMSTFMPIKRIACISFTDAKEQNEKHKV